MERLLTKWCSDEKYRHTKCVPDEPVMTHHIWWIVQNLENQFFTSGFLSLNARNNSWRLNRTINCLCLWTPFRMLLHNPFFSEAVCCIHHPHRKHEHDIVSWTIALSFFWEGCVSIPFLCFSSLADWIKFSKIPKYLEQYFCKEESGTKVNICNFSVFEVVTNFSFIAAWSLSSSSILLSLSYIGGGSSISISETYTAEMFFLYTF